MLASRMEQENRVTLVFYDENYKAGLSDYHLTAEQRMYVGLPLDSLSDCEQDSGRHPFVILYDRKPAGFFVLHGWTGVRQYSQNQDALLLRAFSVNSDFQGIASKALLLLDSFIKDHFPETNEVILAVNQKNFVAQHVYQKAGYIDNGTRAMGRHGEMFILRKRID